MTDSEALRGEVARALDACIAEDLTGTGAPSLWGTPIVRYADAQGAPVRRLREVVVPGHYMPEDFLPAPTVILSYYLPLRREIGKSNIAGDMASAQWAGAYLATNALAARVGSALAGRIRALGHRAAVPENIGIISDTVLMSRWSQRHIAWAAGHGTFGLNNLLISDAGCCGRYYSLVTDLPIAPDAPLQAERCLYKRDGTCGVCARRCVAGALTPDGFDRAACYAACLKNDAIHPGADVCGKCAVGLPCAHACPPA